MKAFSMALAAKTAAAFTLALLVAASQAQAADIVNTQVPAGGLLGSDTLDANDWLAQRFSVTATTSIDSVMAYVLSSDSAHDVGGTFTIALYANSAANLPALNWTQAEQGKLYEATATYQGDGWNGLSNLNWSIGAGSYWLALEQNGNADNAGSLQLPTGALPVAQGVAFYAGGTGYAAAGAGDTFGLHVTAAAAVPEPDSWALCLVSLAVIGGVGARAGRRR